MFPYQQHTIQKCDFQKFLVSLLTKIVRGLVINLTKAIQDP